MRIGIGIDVHAFAVAQEKRPLLLGGVRIDHECGLAGHSDADVLTHAVMDALLGAARHGDIGELFPSDNPAYLGADSLVLLAGVRDLLKQDGWLVEDIDCVIIAQRPHLAPYRQHMRQNIAGVLEMNPANVGIKATTSDYLGFEGREEGISAYAMALLRHPDSHKQ